MGDGAVGGVLERLLALRGETIAAVRSNSEPHCQTNAGSESDSQTNTVASCPTTNQLSTNTRSSQLDPNKQSTNTGVLRRSGVLVDAEFVRIDALPRRIWQNDPELPEKIALLTSALRTPTGTQTLWPIQAAALCEASDCQGLLAGVRVGGGKTLGSLATSAVPGLCELERPVLFVPAKHREKTERAYMDLRVHWRLDERLQFLNYEQLSDVRFHEWLFRYRPELIVCDEAHKLKTEDSARRLRFEAYLKEFPHTVIVLWSGTFLRKSVRELRVPCEWTLRERSPVPRTWKGCEDWSSALDPDSLHKLAPGALSLWCDETESKAGIVGVRRAYGRRLAETPGVIISNGATEIGASLEISVRLIPNPDMDPALAHLRSLWELPDGWTIRDAPVFWDARRQLSEGFYYTCDPWPPEPWIQARREWHSLCRSMQADVSEDAVSELMCRQRCEQMGAAAPYAYRVWAELESTFTPTRKTTWISTALLERAATWIKRHAGLVWVDHTAFGQRLQDLTGAPYFGAGAQNAQVGPILTYQGRNAICQLQSCMEGFDLQDRWSRNLVVTPHPNGVYWEQFLARTHRYGQRAPEVTCEVWCKTREDWESVLRAREDESFVASVSGDAHRKLIIADWLTLPTAEDVRAMRGPAWRKKVADTQGL